MSSKSIEKMSREELIEALKNAKEEILLQRSSRTKARRTARRTAVRQSQQPNQKQEEIEEIKPTRVSVYDRYVR